MILRPRTRKLQVANTGPYLVLEVRKHTYVLRNLTTNCSLIEHKSNVHPMHLPSTTHGFPTPYRTAGALSLSIGENVGGVADASRTGTGVAQADGELEVGCRSLQAVPAVVADVADVSAAEGDAAVSCRSTLAVSAIAADVARHCAVGNSVKEAVG